MIDFVVNQLLAKVGLSFDPNAHPAENIAGMLTQLTGRQVEGYEVVEAADKALSVVHEVAKLDKAAVSALFEELRPVVAEIDPVKAAALLRAVVHHVKVTKDDGEVGTVGASLGSSGASAGAH